MRLKAITCADPIPSNKGIYYKASDGVIFCNKDYIVIKTTSDPVMTVVYYAKRSNVGKSTVYTTNGLDDSKTSINVDEFGSEGYCSLTGVQGLDTLKSECPLLYAAVKLSLQYIITSITACKSSDGDAYVFDDEGEYKVSLKGINIYKWIDEDYIDDVLNDSDNTVVIVVVVVVVVVLLIAIIGCICCCMRKKKSSTSK